MLTLICTVLLISVFGKVVSLAIRVVWGIVRILFSFAFFPVALIIFLAVGLAYMAVPVLALVGAVALVGWFARKAS